MKKLKYIFMLILAMAAFQSCLVENKTRYDLNADGPNFAGFELTNTALSFVSNGDEYGFTLRVKVTGPTSMNMTNPVTMTVAADVEAMEALAASDTTITPAIEGTHFRIDNPQITLSKDNNYLNLFPITILTEGIIAPLAKKPVLILKVTEATGDPKIVNNGKPIQIDLNYGCFSNLAGTYDVHTVYTSVAGVVTEYDWTETIVETGIGTYRTGRVGHWTPADLGGTPGYTFMDVCNKITIPGQNLVDLYSNWVEGTIVGTVDPSTGDIYVEYSICVDTACRQYVSTYVKQ